MTKKTLKVTNLWINYLTKKRRRRISRRKKDYFQDLNEMNFQKNTIWYKMTNVMSIDEKTNKAQKYDVNMNKYEKWDLYQSITLQYLLSANHSLPISHTANNMVINKKENGNLSISSWIYVKS